MFYLKTIFSFLFDNLLKVFLSFKLVGGISFQGGRFR